MALRVVLSAGDCGHWEELDYKERNQWKLNLKIVYTSC